MNAHNVLDAHAHVCLECLPRLILQLATNLLKSVQHAARVQVLSSLLLCSSRDACTKSLLNKAHVRPHASLPFLLQTKLDMFASRIAERTGGIVHKVNRNSSVIFTTILAHHLLADFARADAIGGAVAVCEANARQCQSWQRAGCQYSAQSNSVY